MWVWAAEVLLACIAIGYLIYFFKVVKGLFF